MKKTLLYLPLITSFLATFALANECIDNINKHVIAVGTQLDLSNCNLQDDDISSVALFLTKNPNIKDVFLDENNIGANGAAYLANNQTVS
jgi:hypothetical protein